MELGVAQEEVAGAGASTLLHATTLDALASVNSLLTGALFTGLAFKAASTNIQTGGVNYSGLQARQSTECAARPGILVLGSAVATVCGVFFLTSSLVKVVQLKLGCLFCSSASFLPKCAAYPLLVCVLVGVLIFAFYVSRALHN